ncbi:DUF2399 domain-containing protein [Lacticaseibacillus porcinae]|uniref:DUF2399 domain-containing protein n=1 Tax=Lacticaseibacillus porcinae TaxID=1123687 RepID=UPI000F7A7757|nr:DUF2399 domain-containing protein [Lacticaseibacillus porcinae]
MSKYQEAYEADTGHKVPESALGLSEIFEKIEAGEPLPPRGQQAVDAGLTAHTLNDATVAPVIFDYYQWVVTHYFKPGQLNELSAKLIGMAFTCANIFQTDLPQPLTLNPWQVDAMAEQALATGQAVVVENNGVFILLHQRHPEWPLINQGGNDFQPAYVTLMRRLTERGLRIAYLGDLDSTGIQIADRLLARMPRVHREDFLSLQTPEHVSWWISQVGKHNIKRSRRLKIEDPILKQELDTIVFSKKFVEQEQLIFEYEPLITAWLRD